MRTCESTTITILNDTARADICMKYSDGTAKVKTMPVISLIRLLQGLEISNGEPLGEIPEGYVSANFSDSKNYKVVLRIKALSCPVQFMGKLYRSIPYPELCFVMKYNAGKLNESRVYAIQYNKTLCHYPYGNVYDDGKICWGRYQHPAVNSLKDSENAARKFYELATNNDLWSNSYVNYKVGVLSNMYDLLDGKESFPPEWLVPIPGMSIEELL